MKIEYTGHKDFILGDLDVYKRQPSDDIDDELMDNISLILTVANGLYNPENHIESE